MLHMQTNPSQFDPRSLPLQTRMAVREAKDSGVSNPARFHSTPSSVLDTGGNRPLFKHPRDHLMTSDRDQPQVEFTNRSRRISISSHPSLSVSSSSNPKAKQSSQQANQQKHHHHPHHHTNNSPNHHTNNLPNHQVNSNEQTKSSAAVQSNNQSKNHRNNTAQPHNLYPRLLAKLIKSSSSLSTSNSSNSDTSASVPGSSPPTSLHSSSGLPLLRSRRSASFGLTPNPVNPSLTPSKPAVGMSNPSGNPLIVTDLASSIGSSGRQNFRDFSANDPFDQSSQSNPGLMINHNSALSNSNTTTTSSSSSGSGSGSGSGGSSSNINPILPSTPPLSRLQQTPPTANSSQGNSSFLFNSNPSTPLEKPEFQTEYARQLFQNQNYDSRSIQLSNRSPSPSLSSCSQLPTTSRPSIHQQHSFNSKPPARPISREDEEDEELVQDRLRDGSQESGHHPRVNGRSYSFNSHHHHRSNSALEATSSSSIKNTVNHQAHPLNSNLANQSSKSPIPPPQYHLHKSSVSSQKSFSSFNSATSPPLRKNQSENSNSLHLTPALGGPDPSGSARYLTSGFRSTVRRKVDGIKDGIKQLKPSRAPVDQDSSNNSDLPKLSSEFLPFSGRHVHSQSNHAALLPNMPSATKGTESHSSGLTPLTTKSQLRPLSRAMSLRSFSSSAQKPFVNQKPSSQLSSVTASMATPHLPPTASQARFNSLRSDSRVESLFDHVLHPDARENDDFFSSRAEKNLLLTKSRLKPGRAPLQPIDSQQRPSLDIHLPSDPDLRKAVDALSDRPASSMSSYPRGYRSNESEDALLPDSQASPPVYLNSFRSPVFHESANHLRRQIALEVKSNQPQPTAPSAGHRASSSPESSPQPESTFAQSSYNAKSQLTPLSSQPSSSKLHSSKSQAPFDGANQAEHGDQEPTALGSHLRSDLSRLPSQPRSGGLKRYEASSLDSKALSSAVPFNFQPREVLGQQLPPSRLLRKSSFHSQGTSEEGVEDGEAKDVRQAIAAMVSALGSVQSQSQQRKFYVREDDDARAQRQSPEQLFMDALSQLGLQQQLPAVAEPNKVDRNIIRVNSVEYSRQCIIGKGGSSKVYRASLLKDSSSSNKLVAIKVVGLKSSDSSSFSSFCNEIDLLKRLKGHDRIIELIDSFIDYEKQKVWLVMELGEIDLSQLLNRQLSVQSSVTSNGISLRFVKHIWEQMLEAVHAVHEAGIIHTDLKPANFVLVQGSVKIIDFGIAKAVPADTTNISRETQIGTANYMSPEALMLQIDHRKKTQSVKMGRGTDIWALGCILYQMIYGHTPFSKLTGSAKINAIRDPHHKIEYPQYIIFEKSSRNQTESAPHRVEESRNKVKVDQLAIETIKTCLKFKKEDRSSIPELLQDRFLIGCSTGFNNVRVNGKIELDEKVFDEVIMKSFDWYQKKLLHLEQLSKITSDSCPLQPQGVATGSQAVVTDSLKKKFIKTLKENIMANQTNFKAL